MIFIVKYGTLGMNFTAGQINTTSIGTAKPIAADLLARRRLKSIDYGTIVDEHGTDVALLNISAYAKNKTIEWLTIR